MLRARVMAAVVMVFLLFAVRPVHAVDIEFSAFGDITSGFSFGDPVSKGDAVLFQRFGVDPDPVNRQRGFGITGTDFVVVAHLNDRLFFLSEVNLQRSRGQTSDIALDMERNFLDYRIKDWLNVQVGLFFYPHRVLQSDPL